ncbi:RNA 2',3'-cyclic phosphodiesterase [Salinirubrum litoreum]|uniref:RNA 2',3'-cyclic phosphodiesterase n=1 Tax=Salinirubrum litoreum TaxID=1126234 RepID=A0ABD5RDI5_9EURY|nr:RNA 2',3'-cyclic phosphodiesterase [Salinirubrum litoreum]
MRLFVSVDLPDALADPLADLQQEFGDAPGLRFTDPEQAHLTLKFLGEVDEKRVPEIEDALETAVDAAGVDPFDATVGGLGVFPSMEYISVVWVGIREGAGREELTRLHEAVERETTALGFDPEDHDFTPHVTLARMNDARSKVRVQQVVREQDPTLGTMRVSQIRLKASELDRDGPTYSTVSRIGL